MRLDALWVGPGEGTGIVLEAALLIGERVGDCLAGTHASCRELPLPVTAVEGHGDVLLRLTRNGVVDDDIACGPSTGLEPELCLAGADAGDALGEGASAASWRRRRRSGRRRRG